MDNTNQGYTELDQAWKKMAEIKFSKNKIKKQEIMEAIKSDSHSTIKKLKHGLKIKLGFCILITPMILGYTIMHWDKTPENWFFLGLTAMYVLISILLYNKYRKMNDGIIEGKSVLENLRHNAKTIRSMLYVERIWGVVTCLALVIYFSSRYIVNGVDTKTSLIGISAYLVFIIVLGFWAEYANKKKFGDKLKEMEDNIIRLETLS